VYQSPASVTGKFDDRFVGAVPRAAPALAAAASSSSEDPNCAFTHGYIGVGHAFAGVRLNRPFARAGDRERFLTGPRKAGLSEE
jgi:hypothetical protein